MDRPLKARLFDRANDDWYVEPEWVSDALFAVEKFEGIIWDPACGQGNIIKAAKRAKLRSSGSDIVDRRSGLFGTADFFSFRLSGFSTSHSIVTNPPFGKAIVAEKFIHHALSLRPQKLAVFVDSRFLFGKARANGLFNKFPPARVWLITPRPSCPPGEYLLAGGKASGGSKDFCWIVWDYEPTNSPKVGWIK